MIRVQRHLLCLLVLISSSSIAQSTISVWQGFSHKWTYNHRVNRLGDYISNPKSNQAAVVHTAASGLGKDSVYFTAYYASIQPKNIDCFSGKTSFVFKGREGVGKVIRKTILIYPDSSKSGIDKFVSILNGFDLISKSDADKFVTFSIKINSPVYDKTTNELKFDIEAQLKMDCSSLECSWWQQTFEYSLDIYYLIFSGRENDLSAREMAYNRDIVWNTSTETAAVPLEKSVSIAAGFNNGIFAYQQFELKLNDEHHFADYENAITTTMINPTNQSATCIMQLFFSNWKNNMRKSPASGGQSFFAYAKKGSAAINGVLQFIQFNGDVEYGKKEGALFWEGKNKLPIHEDAVKTIPLVNKN